MGFAVAQPILRTSLIRTAGIVIAGITKQRAITAA
jgi:hypothetical protein